MLIKDIEPIKDFGTNLFEKKKVNKVIDEIIELPLRKACKIFKKKGVQTVMSSANKDNVLKNDEKSTEKEDVRGKEFFYPSPTFLDAGHGYAWIMLNFDTLSNKNKDWLFFLEERKNEKGESIGEKAVWFVHPFRMGNLDYKIRTGEYTLEYLKTILPENEIPKNVKKDERLGKFEEKSIVLAYNDRYPSNVVMLRMPITEDTTAKEVEEYFSKLAKSFHKQRVIKKVKEGFPNRFMTIDSSCGIKQKIKNLVKKVIPDSKDIDDR